MNEHWSRAIALGPRTECLETPIEDPKKVERTGWNNHKYYTTEINKKEVDNNGPNSIG
jgi:hypothetical protein